LSGIPRVCRGLIGFGSTEVNGLWDSLLIGENAVNPLPATSDDDLICGEARKVEGKVDSRDEGIPEEMVTTLEED